MGRDHQIKGETYHRCTLCGFWTRKSDTRVRGGQRFCLNCWDDLGTGGVWLPPPTAKWDDYNKRHYKQEYGVCVWLEEFGASPRPSFSNSEYGVLTYIENFYPASSISGEYGTLVYVPDYHHCEPGEHHY